MLFLFHSTCYTCSSFYRSKSLQQQPT